MSNQWMESAHECKNGEKDTTEGTGTDRGERENNTGGEKKVSWNELGVSGIGGEWGAVGNLWQSKNRTFCLDVKLLPGREAPAWTSN